MDKKDLVLAHVSMDGITVEYLWFDETVKERWIYHYNHFANRLKLKKYQRLVRPTKRHKFKMDVHPKCAVTPLLYDCHSSRYWTGPSFEKERVQGVLKTINQIKLPREVSLFAKEAFGKHLVSGLKVQKRW